MTEIDVRPALLRIIGNACGDVAPMVGRGKTAFDDANTLGRLNLGELESAAALTACHHAWRDAFREGTRVIGAVSDNIRGTAAVVEAADQNAASLYLGPKPDLPPIPVNIGEL